MSNPMQDLHTLGLNPFAVTLLAESMLKSAYVKNCGTKPLTFEFPVRRGDCEGWAGVRITIEAVPAAGVMASQAPSELWKATDALLNALTAYEIAQQGQSDQLQRFAAGLVAAKRRAGEALNASGVTATAPVSYTHEPAQDALLAKFAAAGFKYDGFGGWQADLTTTELLSLGGALGVTAVHGGQRQEDFCGVQQTLIDRETSHGIKYQIARWTCPNCGKACSCIYVDGDWCHGDGLSISFGPEKEADGTWKRHHKCTACWLAAGVAPTQAPSKKAE